MANHIDDHREEFQATLDHYHREVQSLRTGRANGALVENIRVEAYGQSMDLKSVCSITIPDAKTIQIEPWDKGLVKDIETALIAADLGMQPSTTGTTIRLSVPAMTEENRKRMVKQAHELAESARIVIRSIREKIRDDVQGQEKAKTIGEDEKFRIQEELDKRVKEVNAKIEDIAGKKEEEIMTI